MPQCETPRSIFVRKEWDPTLGKFDVEISFNPYHLGRGDRFDVPCGKCAICLRNRASEWANRCVNEASLYDSNLFVTLTYRPENIPEGGNLKHRDFQLFMMRLRKYCSTHGKPSPRYYMCGEYGERRGQPHYHAILFNFSLPDLEQRSTNFRGDALYTSKTLEKIWSHGFVMIGAVSAASCSYVARYVGKKLTSNATPQRMYMNHEDAAEKRNGIFFEDARVPQYCRSSTNPGIGAPWLDKFVGDVYPRGNYILPGGLQARIPRYYKRRAEYKLGADVDSSMLKRKAVAVRRSKHLEKTGPAPGVAEELALEKLLRLYSVRAL